MFTGIIEQVGVVAALDETSNGRKITIECAPGYLTGVQIGDSVALDGVCQTVVRLGERSFDVEAIGTTLSRTTFGGLAAGDRVNLERAMALGGRLGGHLVQGHVDGTGVITRVERVGEHVLLQVRMPPEVAEVTVLHGSIALHGVSLTVNALYADDVAEVALIPHTWDRTNLQYLRVGDAVNLEGDMLGRFVVGYLRRIAMTLPLREQ
jgi:riboflavin synthase